MPNTDKPCKHRFRFAWYSGRGRGGRKIKILKKTLLSKALTFGFRCDKCGEQVERKATPKERALHDKRVAWPRKPHVHTVWHEFQRRFKKNGHGENEYRLIGYDLMVSVEKWAKKYPREVRCVGIDDSYFASSLLLLVEHRHSRGYMGTTAVVIPQCTGDKPMEFFLYPNDRNSLIAALVNIRAAARLPTKRGREDEAVEAKLTRKYFRHPPVI